MLKAYKYRLFPTEVQKNQLTNYLGCCRFIYNLGLETKIAAYVSAKKNITCFDLIKQTTDLKKSVPWLAECPAQSLQMSLRNLDNAYTKFFKGAGFPKFKKKYSTQSIQFPQGVFVNFDKKNLIVPKLKNINCVFHRKFNGIIKTVTISKTTTNKYFASILVENKYEVATKISMGINSTVGIDMGIKTFATLSDGTQFNSPKFLRGQLKGLRIEQRKLRRKFKKGIKEQSKGYQKQKLIVAKLHEKIANRRKDFLQKTSTAIIKQYDTICLENLNIQGMMKSNLAKSIADVSWSEFNRILEYKALWYGKNIIYIGRFEPSSKICSICGTINKELKLSDRVWTCKCGVTHDRDKNAAINIKNFGLRNQPNIVNVNH